MDDRLSHILDSIKLLIADRDVLFRDIEDRLRDKDLKIDALSERLKDQQELIKDLKNTIQHLFQRLEQIQKDLPPTKEYGGYDDAD